MNERLFIVGPLIVNGRILNKIEWHKVPACLSKYCKIGFDFIPRDEMIRLIFIFKQSQLDTFIKTGKQIFKPFQILFNIIYFYTNRIYLFKSTNFCI